MNKNISKKGLTLVELMIAIAAASILILTMSLILMMVFQSWRINNAYVEMRRNIALAVYLISRDVRESSITNVPPGVTVGSLQLSPHPPARNNTVTYTKAGSALTSSGFGTVIPRGVQTFTAERNDNADGVYLTIGMTNSIFGSVIAVTNKVFINTRN